MILLLYLNKVTLLRVEKVILICLALTKLNIKTHKLCKMLDEKMNRPQNTLK